MTRSFQQCSSLQNWRRTLSRSGQFVQRTSQWKQHHVNLSRLFKHCRDFSILDLSYNQLDNRTFNQEQTRELTHLKQLNLANNQLKDIELVRDMRGLEKLDFSQNKIESIIQANSSYNLLGRPTRLKRLDLSGNLIRSLNKEMFLHCGHTIRELSSLKVVISLS